MTISDNKINNFFSKHKVGTLAALKNNTNKKSSIDPAISKKTADLSKDTNLDEKELINSQHQNHFFSHKSDFREDYNENTNIYTEIKTPHSETISTCNEHIVSNKLASNYQNTSQSLATSEQIISNKLASNYQNTSQSLATSEQIISDKLASSYQHVSQSLATSKQNVSNSLPNSLAKLSSLHDIDLDNILTIYSLKETELLYILYEKCALKCNQICTVYSNELTSKLAVSSNRLRNLFSRITKKGEVVVLKNKRGLNALRIVEISNNLYQKLHETCSNSLANSLARAPYSSSSNINTTTTKTNVEEKIVDISLLQEYGFCEEHASQLLRITSENIPIKPEVIQNSISYFYYDLKYNGKEKEIKKTPVQFFMGIMRNEKIYNPPKNYKSQAEIAMEIILNQKKEEQDRLNKKIEKFKEAEYEHWIKNLDNQEKGNIISNKTTEHRHTPDVAYLKIHFTNNLWPELKNSLLDTSMLELNINTNVTTAVLD